MTRALAMLVVCQVMNAAALAQSQQLPPDLSGLPDTIKNLKWQSIDMASVKPLERARSLLILNHCLDEIAASTTSQADLLSSYIDEKNLGPDYAANPPQTGKKQLTYDDSLKIAVAMLRGPMANSQFASELSGQSDRTLNAYLTMYEHSCQRCWSEVDESRQQVLAMTAYLKSKGMVPEYQAWATQECAQRQQEHEKAVKAAAAASEAKLATIDANLAARERGEAAANRGSAPSNNSQLRAQNQQLQQTLANMENQIQQQGAQAAQNAGDDNDNYDNDGWWAPTYYGAGDWYRDAGYCGAARAATADRYASWHGAPRIGVRR